MQRWLPWVLRAVWIGAGVAGSAALEGATEDRSAAVAGTATWGAGALWVLAVAAMAVPAVASLTATRVLVPLAVPVAATTWLAGAETGAGAAALAAAVVATVVAGSADLGRAFVQASAYGDESRHPLRPPLGFVLAAVGAWVLWAGALLAGPLLLAARPRPFGDGPGAIPAVIAGVVLIGLVGGGAWALGRRWHLLARRWLVYVPAGMVVHDPVVLGETLMLRRSQIARVGLAPADTQALDLTGPTSGHAIEVTTTESVTALLPPTPDRPTGRAVHLRAFLVAPSRPGQALAEAARRRLPVH